MRLLFLLGRYDAYCIYFVLFSHKSTSNSRKVNFFIHDRTKGWPVAFKEHANTSSGMYSDYKNLFDRLLD